jgi:hypothetical protein
MKNNNAKIKFPHNGMYCANPAVSNQLLSPCKCLGSAKTPNNITKIASTIKINADFHLLFRLLIALLSNLLIKFVFIIP